MARSTTSSTSGTSGSAKKTAAKPLATKKAVAKKVAAPAKKAPVAKKAAPAKKVTPPTKKAAPAAKKAPTSVKKAPATKATPAAAKKAAAPATKTAPAKKAAPAAKKAAPAKKAAAPAPAKKLKSPYGARFLAAQEKLLQEERATYSRQMTSLRAEAAALVADFESGDVQFDEESGEGDTINIERERDLALSESARQIIEEIDHAIEKLALGTYGICEISGEAIPPERLEAIPWARERVEYKIGGISRR